MKEFWVAAGVLEEKDPGDTRNSIDFSKPFAFKKFTDWPERPQLGEWIETDDGGCMPAVEVWHRRIDGTPSTIVYVNAVNEESVRTLIEQHGWRDLPSPTFQV